MTCKLYIHHQQHPSLSTSGHRCPLRSSHAGQVRIGRVTHHGITGHVYVGLLGLMTTFFLTLAHDIFQMLVSKNSEARAEFEPMIL